MIRRRLLGIVAIASLLLAMVVAAAWVRGYWYTHFVQVSYRWHPETHLFKSWAITILSASGQLQFAIIRADYDLQADVEPWVDDFLRQVPAGAHVDHSAVEIRPDRPLVRTGFDLSHATRPGPGKGRFEVWLLAIPSWFAMLLCGILPALWWRKHRRLRLRRLHGLCVACGYDLRATPKPSGALLDRCPECGTAPAVAKIETTDEHG